MAKIALCCLGAKTVFRGGISHCLKPQHSAQLSQINAISCFVLVHRLDPMPGRMRRERVEALLSANNDLTRFAEAENVGILAAETYFPAQYVSIFSIRIREIKANTSRFGVIPLISIISSQHISLFLALFRL